MKLESLIKIADSAYPEGMRGSAEMGDQLAKFMLTELKETYDPQATSLEQIRQAMLAMDNARQEVLAVVCAFQEVLITKGARQRHTWRRKSKAARKRA